MAGASSSKIVRVKLEDILPHPKNANVTPTDVLEKIARNITRTGNYPPLIIRKLSETKYQCLDGWHRSLTLRKDGHKEADCVVWDVDDTEADIAIATLNTLHGTDDKGKRATLIRDLSESMSVDELALIITEDAETIAALLAVAGEEAPPAPAEGGAGASDDFEVMEFVVTRDAAKVIRAVLESIKSRALAEGAASVADGTALEYLCAEYQP